MDLPSSLRHALSFSRLPRGDVYGFTRQTSSPPEADGYVDSGRQRGGSEATLYHAVALQQAVGLEWLEWFLNGS